MLLPTGMSSHSVQMYLITGWPIDSTSSWLAPGGVVAATALETSLTTCGASIGLPSTMWWPCIAWYTARVGSWAIAATSCCTYVSPASRTRANESSSTALPDQRSYSRAYSATRRAATARSPTVKPASPRAGPSCSARSGFSRSTRSSCCCDFLSWQVLAGTPSSPSLAYLLLSASITFRVRGKSRSRSSAAYVLSSQPGGCGSCIVSEAYHRSRSSRQYRSSGPERSSSSRSSMAARRDVPQSGSPNSGPTHAAVPRSAISYHRSMPMPMHASGVRARAMRTNLRGWFATSHASESYASRRIAVATSSAAERLWPHGSWSSHGETADATQLRSQSGSRCRQSVVIAPMTTSHQRSRSGYSTGSTCRSPRSHSPSGTWPPTM